MLTRQLFGMLFLLGIAAAPDAHAGDRFKLEVVGFDPAGSRFGYWLYGKDAASALSHAELHLVAPEGDTVLTTPDLPGGDGAAREVLQRREAKRLEALTDTGRELYESGSAIATTFYDQKPFELRIAAAQTPDKLQPVEVIFTQDGQPEVLYAGADGHAYSLNHVLRAAHGALLAVVFKLSAGKAESREYRVALANTATHPVAKERRPKLLAAPVISVKVDTDLSREESSGQFAQARALVAHAGARGDDQLDALLEYD